MIKFYLVKKKLERYYNEDIAIGNCKANMLIDSRSLKYMESIGNPVKEAEGNHIMYVVYGGWEQFEETCKNNDITIVELPIDEFEYKKIHDIVYNKKRLVEKVIKRGDNFKIIIRSDEDTNHFIPHCHVEFSDGSTASVSIDDNYTIFAMSGKAKTNDYKKPVDMIKKNVQALRKEWNDFSKSTYKFALINGQYIVK